MTKNAVVGLSCGHEEIAEYYNGKSREVIGRMEYCDVCLKDREIMVVIVAADVVEPADMDWAKAMRTRGE